MFVKNKNLVNQHLNKQILNKGRYLIKPKIESLLIIDKLFQKQKK